MKVLLMDKNENILYHGSTFSTNDVVVQITFPKIFSDHTIYGKKIHFGVSKAYHCQSAYFNKSGIASFTETCGIPVDFSKDAYQPTPDGTYDLRFNNSSNLLEDAEYLGLVISGSYILNK
eukprot:00621.XXX_1854_1431_1 [CDS] Oithona nana genome sequencing.